MKKLAKKTKDWVTIQAPSFFNEKAIGKTLSSDPKLLIGRKMTVNSMDLTGNLSKYYLKVIFRINQVDGSVAKTSFSGSECVRDYISRMVVRRVRRIDTIQDLKTKDGVTIRVKGIAITSRKVKSSVEKVIRKRIAEMIKQRVESATLENLINQILSDEMKNRILQEARRIYPIRNFEIRKTQVLS